MRVRTASLPLAMALIFAANSALAITTGPQTSNTGCAGEVQVRGRCLRPEKTALRQQSRSATPLLASNLPFTAGGSVGDMPFDAPCLVGDANESILETVERTNSLKDDEQDELDASEPPVTIAAADSNSSFVPQGDNLQQSISELTRQIILKEIALERFNLHYLRNAAKQGRWKGLRYAFLQEANNSLGITGGIIGTVERGRNIHTSSRVRPCIQQQANFIPAIGSIIGFSAAFVEFNINQFHEVQAWRKGFSPGKAIAHVNGLNRDIEALLKQRDALVRSEQENPALAARAQADMLEGKVLRDLRDLSLIEYQRFHVGARKLLAFQQTQYLFDMSKFTMNALGGYFAYMALHRGDRRWNVRAGIMYDIAGGLMTGGPILSRVFAKVVGETSKYRMKGTLANVETRQVAILEQDQRALEALLKGNDSVVDSDIERLAVYGDRTKRFQEAYDKVTKERAKARLTATQNVGAGIIVGGSKIASGTLFTILGHKRYRTKTQTAGRVTNHLLFASGVVGLQAASFSFADTLRIQVQGEISRHKLAKAHKLPGELAAARLKYLDDLEARMQKQPM